MRKENGQIDEKKLRHAEKNERRVKGMKIS